MDLQDRRSFLRLSGTMAATAAVASACSDLAPELGRRDAPKPEKVRIGLLLFQKGVFKILGDDQRAGWNLYLHLSGGLLGGREVEVVESEEALDPETSIRNVKKLIEKEAVHALVGVTFSSNLIPIMPVCQQAKVPLISPYASTLQAQGKEYIWRTCALSGYDGYAIAEYVSQKHQGEGVYLLASDYAAGWDEIVGFKKRFTGKIAGEEYVPFPDTQDYGPFLRRIKESGAAAVFSFLPADLAVTFIKQFDKAGLHGKVALYGAEGMTELPFLEQEKDSATNLMDAFYYSEGLDNAANRKFVSEYAVAAGARPYVLPMVAYDAAAVLDKAIAGVRGDPTPDGVERRIREVGLIESPRGRWQFGKNRAPLQHYYLRQVQRDGDVLANVVLQELGVVGDLPLAPAKAPHSQDS